MELVEQFLEDPARKGVRAHLDSVIQELAHNEVQLGDMDDVDHLLDHMVSVGVGNELGEVSREEAIDGLLELDLV